MYATINKLICCILINDVTGEASLKKQILAETWMADDPQNNYYF
ncbi:hypothetical protein [Aquimarina sp. ERC-38]|nr:hypothetical protein [Aquimarina sp. ERC-38]